MMSIKTKPFDISSRLKTADDIKLFLQIMLEENGIDGLVRGLGHAAKAKGMTEVARMTGMSRSSLYESLSGNASPKLETVDRVLHAFGLSISVDKAA